MTETAVLNIMAAIVAVIAPLVTARVTSHDARKLIKIGVCLTLAAVAGGIAAYGRYQTGEATDWPTLAMAAYGVAQLAYRAIDAAYERATGLGLNEQDWVYPDRGLGA